MAIFHLTSDNFEGFVEFEFNKDGYLTRYDTENATMSKEHLVFLLKRFPRHIDQAEELMSKSDTATFTEIVSEVTFEMFWNKYNEKVNSSRKRALQKWNRMSKSDRIKAYQYINKYFMSIPYGTRKKYAETYLNAELWNN
ncbi:MAG: hypothetical protein JEY96_16830 [Bacteroidales bacterium]|nr:hypothetical protein [Bacteroidales bacterium]